MTYREIILKADKVCGSTKDAVKLGEALRDVELLLQRPDLNAENAAAAKRCRFKLLMKLGAADFYSAAENGFSDYKALEDAARAVVKLCDETVKIGEFSDLTAASERTRKAVVATMDYALALKRVIASGAADDFKTAASAIEASAPPSGIPAGYAAACLLLKKSAAEAAQRRREELLAARYGAIYGEFDTGLDLPVGMNYYPGIPGEPGTLVRFTTLCNPFSVELDLLCLKSDVGGRPAAASAAALKGAGAEGAEYCFSRLFKETGAACCYVRGLNALKNKEDCDVVYNAMLSSRFRYFLLADTSPTHDVYNLLTLYGDAERNASYAYVSMPDYGQVVKLMEEAGMLGRPEDYQRLRRYGATIGFVGLNKLTSRPDDWRGLIERLDAENREAFREYALRLPGIGVIVDSGWGYDTGEKRELNENKPAFDYDAKPEFDDRNLRRIFESAIPLRAKCFLCVHYCLHMQQDISAWKDLSEEEIKERAARATIVLSYLLGTPVPTVSFDDPAAVADDGLSKVYYGGLCCGGGVSIRYSVKILKNPELLLNTVLHEEYHAFQHTARRTGFMPWHASELQVSAQRIELWNANNAGYIDIRKDRTAYEMQVMEADAEIFQKECREIGPSYTHCFTFE